MRILKYTLPKYPSVAVIGLQPSDEIISVGLDGDGNPALYAECQTPNSENIRTFRVYFTGAELDSCKHKFLGSIRYRERNVFFVMHVYEVWK